MRLFRRLNKYLVLCLLIFSVTTLDLEAGMARQVLLAVPEVANNQPSGEFLAVIHAAASCLKKNKAPLKISIISDDALAAKYAKIILHSYGLKNQQVEILGSLRQLKLAGAVGLDVYGSLSSGGQDYLRQSGVAFNLLPAGKDKDIPLTRRKGRRDSYSAIIVLGTAPLDETTPSLDMGRRVETAIKLWKRNPEVLLIFSGGRTGGSISEAMMMVLMAYARGISPSDIILEQDSRSTEENAQFSARLAGKMPIEKTILVTRASHLRRAALIFKKYPQFGKVQPVASRILKREIIGDFQDYLAFNDSPRVRQILAKILKEYQGAGW
ncbi:MAG: YdcF family protein [Candidatus Omnitrophota bacterium]|nr:YdcF family protein [Candidatus Omnitrophota bacterium]